MITTGLVFLGVAGLGFAIVAGSLILGLADTDADMTEAGVDLDADAAAAGGLGILSVTGIGSLLFGFGLMGWAGYRIVPTQTMAYLAGIIGALVCFKLTSWVKRTLVRKLNNGSVITEQDLVGQIATVTVEVGPNGTTGQVQVKIGDHVHYVSARAEDDSVFPVRSQVIVLSGNLDCFTITSFDQ